MGIHLYTYIHTHIYSHKIIKLLEKYSGSRNGKRALETCYKKHTHKWKK